MDPRDYDNSETEEIKDDKSEDDEALKEREHKKEIHQRIQRVASGTGIGPGWAMIVDVGGVPSLKSTGGGLPKNPVEPPKPAPRRRPSETATSGNQSQEPPPPTPPKPTGWRCARCAFDDNYNTDFNCRVCRRSRQ